MARAVMTAAFALVLSVRLLAPTGFMPTATPHGLVVKMCGGANSGQSVVIDPWPADDATHHDQAPKQHEAPCAFASLPVLALAADAAPAMSAPGPLLHELDLPPPDMWALARVNFLTPPLRGPPARA